MFVIKNDGRREEFKKEKVIRTCLRAKVTKKVAKEIANYIEKNIEESVTTGKIYRMILDELDKRNVKSSFLLTIRDATSDLSPKDFELFAKKVFEAHDYNVKWNLIINGKCIEHQIDLVAEKNGKKFMVECKRHSNPHRFCGLEVPLEVQARFEDIRDGFLEGKNDFDFNGAWIFTNSKFSEHAKIYAEKKNIYLTGWRFKDDISIEKLIESKKVYPITILKIDSDIKKKLLDKGIITIQDLLRNEKRITKMGLENIIEEAKRISNFHKFSQK